MELAGSLTLGKRSALALGSIAADRVADVLGRALPRTREQIANPETLGALLRDHAPRGAPSLPKLVDARLAGVDFESSNCRNFLVEVEFDASPSDTEVPKTLYVKLPCDELVTRTFAIATGFWELECRFCDRVAEQLPIRVPRVYAVARRGARFVLILENLHDVPGTQLFINRDMAAGTSVERARMCLTTFAELHAHFEPWTPEQQSALLSMENHSFLSPRRRSMTRAMNAAAIGPCHSRSPDEFGEDLVRLCRLATEKWDALGRAWYTGPLTLIHGDSHLGNFFEYTTPNGPRMGMLDFQAVQWSKGVRDVQYFLINSLEPDVLEPHEGALVEHYVAELARFGVDSDLAETRELYRAFAYQTLMTAVVAKGLGPLTERDATVDTILRRSVAALHRLDFGAWLDTLG